MIAYQAYQKHVSQTNIKPYHSSRGQINWIPLIHLRYNPVGPWQPKSIVTS